MSTTIHISPRNTGKTTHALGLSLLRKDSLYVSLNSRCMQETKHIVTKEDTTSVYTMYSQMLTGQFNGIKFKHLIFDEWYFLPEQDRLEVYKVCKVNPSFSSADISIFTSMPFKINPIALEIIREVKENLVYLNTLRDVISSKYSWLIDDFITDPGVKVIESYIENVDENIEKLMGKDRFELEMLNQWKM